MLREYGNAFYFALDDDMKPLVTPEQARKLLERNYEMVRELHPEYGLTGVCTIVDNGVQPVVEDDPCPECGDIELDYDDRCEVCGGEYGYGRINSRLTGRFYIQYGWYEAIAVEEGK